MFSLLETKNSFTNPELLLSKSFDMSQPQFYKASCFYVGWMRGMLVYDNFISLTCERWKTLELKYLCGLDNGWTQN